MPQLIKNAELVENTLTLLEKDASIEAVTSNSIAPKNLFLEHTDACLAAGCSAVWLDSEQGPEELAEVLEKLETIAINFPKFVDGRGYSYARVLRDRMNFKGEVRAIGDVLHDQLYFLKRCGFDAYDIREDTDAQAAIEGLTAFTESYQACTDQPRPLFRRR